MDDPCNERCVTYAICLHKNPEDKVRQCDKFRDFVRPQLDEEQAANLTPEMFDLIYKGHDDEANDMLARVLKDPTIGTVEFMDQRIQVNINYIAERYKSDS